MVIFLGLLHEILKFGQFYHCWRVNIRRKKQQEDFCNFYNHKEIFVKNLYLERVCNLTFSLLKDILVNS